MTETPQSDREKILDAEISALKEELKKVHRLLDSTIDMLNLAVSHAVQSRKLTYQNDASPQ